MNQNKKIIGLVVVLVIIVISIVSLKKNSGYQNNGTDYGTNSTSTTTTGGTASTTASYTMAQVATHKDKSSCWTVIDGNVYDLTNWISQHPGGEQAILSICGIDGTAAFRNQHDHAKRQEDILAGMKIGTLSK